MWATVLVLAGVGLNGFHVPVAPGESLWVEVGGAGHPVVLVPGLFGSAFGYRLVLPLLHERGYRTIIIEPLGTGRSTRPRGADYSLTAQAARVASVMDSLGQSDVLVVGHAIGAAIAFRLAARRPDLVRGIVSLDGGAVESVATPAFRRALHLAPLLRLFGGHGLVRGKLKSGLRAASGDASWVTDEIIDAYVAPALLDLDATLRAYRAMAGARDPEPLHAQLAAIHVPVLLLLGRAPKEGGLQAHDAAALATQLPSLTVEALAGVGHYIQEERPAAVAAGVQRLTHLTHPGQRARVDQP